MMVVRDLILMVNLSGMMSSHDDNYGAAREATREVRFLPFQFVLIVLFSNNILSLSVQIFY